MLNEIASVICPRFIFQHLWYIEPTKNLFGTSVIAFIAILVY